MNKDLLLLTLQKVFPNQIDTIEEDNELFYLHTLTNEVIEIEKELPIDLIILNIKQED